MESLETLGTPPTKPLTERQIQVLQLYANGLRRHEIAKKLFISDHTVISHKRQLQRRLNTYTLAHSIAEGLRKGHIK